MWRILVVDDDDYVLRGIKNALQHSNLNTEWVGEASDGSSGLQAVNDLHPDIIIVDVSMPIMNGLEMLQALQERGFEGETIILSGYADFSFAQKAVRYGVSDYLLKPTMLSDLFAAVEKAAKALDEKQAQRKMVENANKALGMYEPLFYNEWMRMITVGTASEGILELGIPFLEKNRWIHDQHISVCVEMMEADRKNDLSAEGWQEIKKDAEELIEEFAKREQLDMDLVSLYGMNSILVFHFPADTPETELISRIQAFVRKTVRETYGRKGLGIRTGIGNVQKRWEDISLSTEKALYRLLRKEKPESGTPADEDSEITLYSTQMFVRLMDSIMRMDEATVESVIRNGISQMKTRCGEVSEKQLNTLCKEFLAIVRYSMANTNSGMDAEILKLDGLYQPEEIQSLDMLESWLQDLAVKIINHGSWGKKAYHHGIVKKMVQYIQENYAQDISLEEVAGFLHMSRNYLNSLFKEEMGETFTNYTIRVRMEKARNMLLEGNLFVYEVAEKTGYRNVAYFSNLFKKYYHISPSDIGRQKAKKEK